MKFIKTVFVALLVIVLAIVGAIGLFALFFNANHYKPKLIDAMQKTQLRQLELEDNIRLTFLPAPALSFGKVSLSEQNSAAPFFETKSLKLTLSLPALMQGEVAFDGVVLKDSELHLKRYRDGTTNLDDWLNDEMLALPFKLSLDSLKATNTAIELGDALSGAKLELNASLLKTGALAANTPSRFELNAATMGKEPPFEGTLRLLSDFTYDPKNKKLQLRNVKFNGDGLNRQFNNANFSLTGNADVGLLTRQFMIDSAKWKFEADVPAAAADSDVPHLKVAGQTGVVRRTASGISGNKVLLELGWSGKDRRGDARLLLEKISGQLPTLTAGNAHLDLSGKLGTHGIRVQTGGKLVSDFDAQHLTWSGLKTKTTVAAPFISGNNLRSDADGQLTLDWGKQQADLQLDGRTNGGKLTSKIALNGFDAPHYQFDLVLDKLALKGQSGSTADEEKSPDNSGGNVHKVALTLAEAEQAKPESHTTNEPMMDGKKPPLPPTVLKLDWLRDLHIDGRLQIGELTHDRISLKNVRTRILSDGKQAGLEEFSAELYGGKTTGMLVLMNTPEPEIHWQQKMQQVDMVPLFTGLFGEAPRVSGKLDLDWAGETYGKTARQLVLNLSVKGNALARRGDIERFNLARLLTSARARMPLQEGDEVRRQDAKQRTNFSDFGGSFLIKDGIFASQDTKMNSPYLRAQGGGYVNLNDMTLDYVFKTTGIAAPKPGQGGPNVAGLQGVTIPLRAQGKLTDPDYRLDFSTTFASLTRPTPPQWPEQQPKNLEEKLMRLFKGKVKESATGSQEPLAEPKAVPAH